MQKNLQQTITAIVWGSLCLPTLASAADKPSVEKLEETVVWGTQVSNSSVYLGEGDIAVKQADHLSDLLRDQPGVDIGGTHSTNQRINLRGLDDTDLNVTIDGANQNTYMFHHTGNLLINADILKAVDVNVGTNSIVHGGLGGSVAFETKDAEDLLQGDDNFGGRFSVSASHNKAKGGSLTLFGKTGKVDGLLYTTVNNRDNPKDGDGQENIGNDGTIKDTLVKIGSNLTDNQRIELSHGQYEDKGDYTMRPDMGVATNQALTGNNVYPTKYDRKTTVLSYELDKGDKLNVKASASKNILNFWRDERPTYAGIYEGHTENTRFNVTAESNLQRGNTNHQLTYGADVLKQESYATDLGTKQTTEKSTNTAAFLEDRIEFANGIAITPGIRFDSYQADTATSDKTFDKTSGALAVEVPINKYVTAHASTTQLFKGPELAEVYVNQATRLKPNPNIKPETGTNNEIGVKFQKAGFMGADRFTASIKGFQTTIEDAIEATDYPNDNLSGRGAPQWMANMGELEIKGVEASARYKKGKLGTTVTYAKSDSDFKNTGEPLSREIGDTVTLGVDYQARENLSLNWSTIKVMEEDNVATGAAKKPGYAVTNVAANWKPQSAKGVDVSFGIDNVFDKKYTSHASRIGYSTRVQAPLDDFEPGRNVKVTASYNF